MSRNRKSNSNGTALATVEPPALPTPLRVMLEGVAEMNWIEPTAACATVTVPVAGSPSLSMTV